MDVTLSEAKGLWLVAPRFFASLRMTGRFPVKAGRAKKPKQSALESQWADLIQRAWEERPNPSLKVRQKSELNIKSKRRPHSLCGLRFC